MASGGVCYRDLETQDDAAGIMRFVDTHAHLTHEKFRDDLDAVARRAAEAGVAAIIVPSSDLDDGAAALALAERFPQVYAAVGVHPNEAETAPPDVMEALSALARHSKVVAIGEAGMDHYWEPAKSSPASRERQRRVFTQQLELAARLDKPIIIHQRNCATELLEVVAAYRSRVQGVFHCFSESPEIARRVLELGFHISFTGTLTFKRNDALRELAATLPADRVMVETDCPYMSPEPRRDARRCEPAFVTHTAAALAAARGVPLEEIARQTTENAMRLFGLTLSA
ncbi:MAG: TatD family hydrolase [Verrucomicrobiae bacterium]|nr:TatD family hydrolase [Verrucomicrobiae bacterium]